jgi:hypothetical protein
MRTAHGSRRPTGGQRISVLVGVIANVAALILGCILIAIAVYMWYPVFFEGKGAWLTDTPFTMVVYAVMGLGGVALLWSPFVTIGWRLGHLLESFREGYREQLMVECPNCGGSGDDIDVDFDPETGKHTGNVHECEHCDGIGSVSS